MSACTVVPVHVYHTVDGLPAWTAHLEYQELLSGPLLVKLCIEVICCFYLEPRIRLKPFTIQWMAGVSHWYVGA
jgi:hypothetical protein